MIVDAYSSDGKGGEVKFIGADSVRIGPGTGIDADGGDGPGSITISSPGPAAGVGGKILIEIFSEFPATSGDPVDLSAKTIVAGGEIEAGGSINIHGESASTPSGRTVELTAVNPNAGGSVTLSTPAGINVFGAAINVGGEGRVRMGEWYDNDGTYELRPAQAVTVGGTVIEGNSSGGSGSQLTILAKDSVNIAGGTSPSTDIQMNGATGAGDIHVDAAGDGAAYTAGQVDITAGDQGYVRLSAQQTATVLAALPNGNVDIVGVDKGDGIKSVEIVAAAPMSSGQQINITAIDAIRIQHAKLIADGYNGGGQITLAANNITLNSAVLSASSLGSYGSGGAINLNGGAGGIVSLTGSSLSAIPGSMGGSGGIINIRGGTISFAGVNNLNVGSVGAINFYGTVSGTPTASVTPNVYPYSPAP
jgi:hypothetical protein